MALIDDGMTQDETTDNPEEDVGLIFRVIGGLCDGQNRELQVGIITNPQTPHSNLLYINSGRWYLWHVPSTFATVNTHVNVFFVFLPGGISKEWRHIVSANCDFQGETGPIVPMFTGLSGNTWETAKIAHESHNDVRRLCWRHLRSAGRTWAAKAP